MNQRTKLPAVSILMGVFNCQAYLNKSLDSLLNQTFQDFELVVVDDASTDDTRTILQEYAQRDSRISVVRNEKNIGLGPSLNRGLGICHADLVARADGDDIYLPDLLKKQIQFMVSHPEIGMSSTAFHRMNENGKLYETNRCVLQDKSIKFLLLFGPQFVHASAIYRRKLVFDVGGYDEAFVRGPEGYELWARLIKRTTFGNIPNPLIMIRSRPSSATQNKEGGFWHQYFLAKLRLKPTSAQAPV